MTVPAEESGSFAVRVIELCSSTMTCMKGTCKNSILIFIRSHSLSLSLSPTCFFENLVIKISNDYIIQKIYIRHNTGFDTYIRCMMYYLMLEGSMQKILSSANSDELQLLPVWISFIKIVSCPVVLARTSTSVVNRSNECGCASF